MPLWLIILLIAVAVIVLFLIFTYNALVRLRNMVDEAWNQISVQLKRRRLVATTQHICAPVVEKSVDHNLAQPGVETRVAPESA